MAEVNLDIAKESTAQEILSQLGNGVAGVTAQTNAFSECKAGQVNNGESVTITGKGVCYVYITSSYLQTSKKIVVDGTVITNPTILSNFIPIYFEESIEMAVLQSNAGSMSYFVQT